VKWVQQFESPLVVFEKCLQIDDICAVFPVHGSAGVLGALLVGIPIFTIPGADVSFVAQVVGIAVIAGWTVLATALVFGALKSAGQIRVSREHELEGLDLSEHGAGTYPEFGRPDTVIDGGTTGAYKMNNGILTDDEEH
jgi:Amt family ammonium transporter